jgi:hypothetical protein
VREKSKKMGFTKVAEVLKFRDGGLTVEEARRKMIEAKEAPSGMASARNGAVAEPPVVPVVVPVVATPVVTNVLDPEFEEEITDTPTPTPVPVVAPVIVPKAERVESPQFVGEIKQEGGRWVAELRYKNGGGTERFIDNTKNGLMLKLLEGKGHATLRVNKAVRREKLGWSELDKQYPLPDGIAAKDFEEMGDKQQDHLLRTIANEQILIFREAHPEFYKTEANANKLLDFIAKERLPVTFRNLEYAFDELTDSNLPPDVRLEERALVVETPAAPILTQPAPTPVLVQKDSAPAPTVVAPVSTEAPTPMAPAVVVRKRGTTGLQPGQSSSPTEPTRLEDGGTPRQLSEAELRKLPMSELKRIADRDRRANSAQR